MNKFSFYLYLIYSMIFILGCDDQLNIPSDDELPMQNVSYSKHVQPIFNVRCATVGCHDDQTKSGNLSLTSWNNTTSDYSIVFPGNPDQSRLILSIEGKSIYPMPPIGRPPLTQAQIRAIRTWVEEGAKNN